MAKMKKQKLETKRGKMPGNVRTQFKPGQSGNPNGRPKKELNIPDILREIGREQASVKDKRTKLVAVMQKVFHYALMGRPWAVEFIADRTEGKPLQTFKQMIDGKMGISEATVALLQDRVDKVVEAKKKKRGSK